MFLLFTYTGMGFKANTNNISNYSIRFLLIEHLFQIGKNTKGYIVKIQKFSHHWPLANCDSESQFGLEWNVFKIK